MSHFLKSFLLALAAAVLVIAVVYFVQRSNSVAVRQHDIEYLLDFPDSVSMDDQVKAMDAIRIRLKESGSRCSIMPQKDGRYLLKGEEIIDTSKIRYLLMTPGKLRFREVYQIDPMATYLVAADSLLALNYKSKLPPPPEANDNLPVPEYIDSINFFEHPILSSLQIAHAEEIGVYPGYLGFVRTKDVAGLTSLLNSDDVKQICPVNMKFMTGPGDSTYKFLYAIRENQTLTDQLDEARIIHAEIGAEGRPIVYASFDKYGAYIWEKLTEKNIQRPIAILLDTVVLSSPLVVQSVSGGTFTLSGTDTDLFTYVAFMRSGELKHFPIIQSQSAETYSKRFNPRGERRWWILPLLGFAVFALAFTVRFILFKAE